MFSFHGRYSASRARPIGVVPRGGLPFTPSTRVPSSRAIAATIGVADFEWGTTSDPGS